MEKIVICCASGKSGGHIIPNLTLAHEHNAHILFFSGDSALDNKLLSHKQVDWHIPLSLALIPRWKAPFKMMVAFTKSFYYLIKHKPTMIISTGGIIAVPVCVAAFCLRIPIHLYELNATPGKAIKYLAPLATHVYVCFKETQKYFKRSTLVPYPIRFTPTNPQPIAQFSPSRKTIMILGGSQGSQSLNTIWKQTIESNPSLAEKIQVIHQYGNDTAAWDSFYTAHVIPALTFPFNNSIAALYPHADIVICRAGAGSLFETLHFKKKCITIPLETRATNHQVDNARAMAQEYPNLFTMIKESDLKKDTSLLWNELQQVT